MGAFNEWKFSPAPWLPHSELPLEEFERVRNIKREDMEYTNENGFSVKIVMEPTLLMVQDIFYRILMSDINGMDMSDDYLKYRKGYKAGLGMTIGGASLALVGAAGTVTSVLLALPYAFAGKESTMLDVALGTSMVCAVGGIAVMIAGIPTLCVYKKRLNGLETEISAHPGGIGLTLRF